MTNVSATRIRHPSSEKAAILDSTIDDYTDPEIGSMYMNRGQNPINRVDPTGEESIKGNKFGDWDVEAFQPPDRPRLGYVVQGIIAFHPSAQVKCDDIEIIQIARTLDPETKKPLLEGPKLKKQQERQTADGWAVDQQLGNPSAWFFRGAGGKVDPALGQIGNSPQTPVDAMLKDAPQFTQSADWYFEAVAISRTTGEIYGAITWGFDARPFLDEWKMTYHKPKFSDQPSNDFYQSIVAWNRQASGPKEGRNSADQEQINFVSWQANLQSSTQPTSQPSTRRNGG